MVINIFLLLRDGIGVIFEVLKKLIVDDFYVDKVYGVIRVKILFLSM